MSKPELRIVELFSGIGAQKRGIDNTGLFACTTVATSEIDKEATVSYAAIHCGFTLQRIEALEFPPTEEMAQLLKDRNIGYDSKKKEQYNWDKLVNSKTGNERIKKYYAAMILQNNLGDIEKIESLPDCDLLTYSAPCQDFSIQGKQRGAIRGETRSGLLYEVERLLVEKHESNEEMPKFLMMENVKNLVGKKFMPTFQDWMRRLYDLGYDTYWAILNGKQCGVPQNRERTFAISIRKDIDTQTFEFPIPFDNHIRLKDIVDKTVDPSYLLSEQAMGKYKDYFSNSNNRSDIRQVGQIYGSPKEPNPQAGRVYDEEYISPALDTCSGGNKMPKILTTPDFSYCLDANYWKGTNVNAYIRDRRRQLVFTDKWVRKLTETECFRLMGFEDEDVDKAKAVGVSKSQLYKQAGNSIITNCISLIMEHLYKAQYDENYECFDEKFFISNKK